MSTPTDTTLQDSEIAQLAAYFSENRDKLFSLGLQRTGTLTRRTLAETVRSLKAWRRQQGSRDADAASRQLMSLVLGSYVAQDLMGRFERVFSDKRRSNKGRSRRRRSQRRQSDQN